ncbi:hypothetical protein GGR52DRAFT_528026 [Hypoxylon sp. FL1284]|nr:hypothetical protein GGR52DRAFT_528026 [Hypoxylon sp. FL1284]
MTERSPEVLATADLTPISPSPLHLSSPVIIPALQDQADTLSAMSLPNPAGAFAASTTEHVQAGLSGLPAATTRDHAESAGAIDSDESDLYNFDEDNGTEDHKEGAALIEDKVRNSQQIVDQGSATEAQEDVSKTNETSPSSDTSQTLTSQSQANASSSHDPPTSHAQSVHQKTQSATQPAARGSQGPYKLQNPQEQAVVNPPWTGGTDSPHSPAEAPPENSDHHTSAPNNDIDIQGLVDQIIGNATSGSANQASASQNTANPPAPVQDPSLPPRPPMPQQSASSYVRPEDAAGYQQGLAYTGIPTGSSNLPPPPGTYAAGAPGTAQDLRNNVPAHPASAMNAPPNAYPVAQFDATYASAAGAPAQTTDLSEQWETFLKEERRYVSEAKWDRFPEGSRLFIGNLSSDRVSKRQVFEIFYRYGRIAQISLKQAYGFVQYHTVTEGQAAMDNLQGIDVQGRKIHLEFSRTQKRHGEGEKRGNKNRRENDRHDGGRGRRDDYRPGRQPSPRRGHHRQDSQRGQYDEYNARGRSRSPGYGRRDSDQYRRRSPSPGPYRPYSSEADLNLPRRYGADVPDVQFLLLQEVGRDFIGWVERAFMGQNLRVQVMFLSPHYPRDAVIHRQAIEGVHAVVELDYRAQQTGVISLQVFDRSAGQDRIRYDQYQDLDPNVAASLVNRTKSQAQMQPPYPAQYPPPGPHYPNPNPYMPGQYPGQPYPGQPYPAAYPGAGAPPGNTDATIQQILGNLHGPQGHPQGAAIHGHPAGAAPADVNRLLANMGGPNAASPIAPQHAGNYPPAPMNGAPTSPNGDPSRHVQDIMAQLAQFRQ